MSAPQPWYPHPQILRHFSFVRLTFTPVYQNIGLTSGLCILVFLTPHIDVLPNNQSLPILIREPFSLFPYFIELEISTEMGTGAVGLRTSIHYHNKFSEQVVEDLQQVADSVLTL